MNLCCKHYKALDLALKFLHSYLPDSVSENMLKECLELVRNHVSIM